MQHVFTLAATEDVIVTCVWLVVLLLRYPDVQEKCQKHIDEVIGQGRTPSLKDKPKLGYIDAVVLEGIRFSNVVPFPFPRRTMETVKFRGYTIPAGET